MGYRQRNQSPLAFRLKKRSTLLPCGVNIPKPWSEVKDQKVEQLTLNQWVQSVLSKDVKNVLFAGAFDNAVKDPELAKAAVEIAQAQIEDNKIKENSNNQQHRQLESTTLRANQHPCAIHEIRLVELKGYTREQVNALMYNCEVLLMTSRTEGSPQVIKEAMACGCPIVSVDVGDVAERTSGVEGCYIVRTREPKDIAEALLKAVAFEGKTTGREKIIEMGLSNEQVAEQLLHIYEQLLV
jgi:glycosyltransferase involved in cell wall biosynthesis